MYRTFFRVFKFPTDTKTVGNKSYLQYKDIQSLHIGLYQRYPNNRGKSFAFSELITTARPKCCYYIDNKYLSQRNVTLQNLTSDKSEEPSSSRLIQNSKHTIHENQNTVSDNKEENQLDLLEDINFDEITEGDEEKLDQFKLLILEIDVLRQDGMNVPSKMSTEEWKELFALKSKSQRFKFLTFLFKKEMKKLSEKRKKELKRLARSTEDQSMEEKYGTGDMKYGFHGSTIFLRIYDSSINNYDNYRLIRAMTLGQDLIIDCGFCDEMNTMENKLCSKQLIYLFSENRVRKEPFNIHFCNLKKDSILYKQMKKTLATMEDPAFPINIYEEHYLDIFPKEKLVYLTPHCRTELREFNHDDIYIIGAIVDKVNQQPLTLAKAKSEGLRMAHLPLDRYLDWLVGTKSLTINQVANILLDVHITGDWNSAFKHVPRRKLRDPNEHHREYRKPFNRGTILQPPKRFIKRYY